MPDLFYYPTQRGAEAPWLNGILLGWRQSRPPYHEVLFASPEDSVAIIGPPRYGKTGGILIPAAMTWCGSLISTSTKSDVLQATRGRRLELATGVGGDVYVYSPGDRAEVTWGVKNVRWSPLAGCEDPSICEERVAKIIGPKREDQNEQEFFRQQASIVLRGYFHAAALSGLPMRRVKQWVDNNDVTQPMDILRSKADTVPSAGSYLSSLNGVSQQAKETKSSTFSTVNGKLGPLVNNAVVLANLDDPNFDIDHFLHSASTLYIVSPENIQEIIAPLITGLIEAIVTRAYALASRTRGGRLDPPLLLLLDEVGAIAPLPTLPAIMGQGASQGVLCAWAAQSFNQLKAKWGQDWAGAILGSSSHKIIFGGTSADNDLLNQISDAFGEQDRWISPHGPGKFGAARQVAAVVNRQPQNPLHMKEKRLKIDDMFGKPKAQATIIAATPEGARFADIGAPHAATVSPFAEILATEDAVQSGLRGTSDEPEQLKSSAMISRMMAELPPAERRRFDSEHTALLERIRAAVGASDSARRTEVRVDAALHGEIASWEVINAQTPALRLESNARIVHAFAVGAVPHFTFTVIVPPPPQGQRPPTALPVQRAETWSESR